MKLQLPVLGQRNPQWASIILGYNRATDRDAVKNPYTIGWYGCQITCKAMQCGKLPNEVNDILKAQGGYQEYTGNFIWAKSVTLGLNELYVSPRWNGPVPDTSLSKARAYLDEGYVLEAEVDFNPATVGPEQHYVVITGYEGDKFYINDPWSGDSTTMDKYGGFKRGVMQYRVYNKKYPKEGVKPTTGDSTTIPEELTRASEGFYKVADLLGKPRSVDIIVSEINQLLSVEGKLSQKEKDMEELKTGMNKLKEELSGKSEQLEQLKTENEDLKDRVNASIKTITELDGTIDQALHKIDELEKQANKPLDSYTAIELITRGLAKLIGQGR